MVTEIKEKNITTLRKIKEKYATKWIDYVFVDEMNDDDPESSLCYVIYIADTEEELYNHPDPERNTRSGGITPGDKVVFPIEIGGIYAHA